MKKLFVATLTIFVSITAIAQDRILETDWLKPRVGSSGEQLGAEVEKVQVGTENGSTVIDIRLPLDNAEQFDDVEILSGDKNIPMKQVKPHRWIADYEKGDYGLRIFLKRHPQTGFRVRLIGDDDNKPSTR